jgi:hypothetical protein
MAWSGGTYRKGNYSTNGWTGDASLGIGIEAGRHDTQDDDFMNGINQCLNKDGSNAATGNLNIGGNKITNVANATVATDVVTLGQAQGGIPVQGAGATGPTVSCENYNNGAGGPRFHFVKSRGGTIGSNTIVQNGDDIGSIYWYGAAGGSAYNICAQITANIDGTPGPTNDMPGRLSFLTTADGSGTATERMRITNAGRIGIGTTSPTNYFHITNNESNALNAALVQSNVVGDVATAALVIAKRDATTTTSQSLVQFFTNGGTSGQGQITANGALAAAFGSFSDERLKENIQDIPSQIESIYNLRPVEFDYKDGSGHQIGFIAQEVKEIYPDLVGESNGFLTLSDMNKNDARLIKAFQELYDKVKALEVRVAELETA